MPYTIANKQPMPPKPIVADEFYVPPSPRIDVWAREQAIRVASQRSKPIASQRAQAPQVKLSHEQVVLNWHQKRLAVEAFVAKRRPPMPTRAVPPPPPPPIPTRAAPLAPPAQAQALPTFLVTPATPKRLPPPIPLATKPVHHLARKASETFSLNSYEKMLIEDLTSSAWMHDDVLPKTNDAPPSPPLTLVTSGESNDLTPGRARGLSFSDASLTISSPSSGAPSDWSAAHTDDGKACVIVGDHILVDGKSYPLRYGRRGIVTYYHPVRMRQILVHLGEV